MGEMVTIPVNYKGVELEFEAEVQVWQYGYRFLVLIGELTLVFERDNSGEFRAITPEGYTGKLPDRGLVQAIAEVLDAL
jgi:hypothetical protein